MSSACLLWLGTVLSGDLCICLGCMGPLFTKHPVRVCFGCMGLVPPRRSDCRYDLQGMVCLEPAVAGSGPVTLEPGKTWKAKQTLSIRHF